jgi:hypothetical protein
MESPPILQAEPVADRTASVGRVGLGISVAPLVALAALLLYQPG